MYTENLSLEDLFKTPLIHCTPAGCYVKSKDTDESQTEESSLPPSNEER